MSLSIKPPAEPPDSPDNSADDTASRSLEDFLPPQSEREEMHEGEDGHAHGSDVPQVKAGALSRLYFRLMTQPKTTLAALFVFFAGPFCGYYGYAYYHSWQLLEAASVAEAQNDYALVIEKLTEYLQDNPQDLDGALFLTKAHMHKGDFEEATRMIDVVLVGGATEKQQKASYYYLAVIGMLNGDVQAASQHLRKVTLNDAVYSPTFYMRAMLQFYGEGDFLSAKASLEGAMDKLRGLPPLELEEVNRRIDLVRQLWDKQHSDILKITPPLSFDALKEPPKFSSVEDVRGFGFSVPVGAFNNSYYVPANHSHVQQEKMSATENIYLLLAEVAMRQGDADAAEGYLRTLEQIKRDADEKPSIKHLYFIALLAINEGDYINGADYYHIINDRHENADANAMLASTRWVLTRGGVPEQKIFDTYDAALRQQPHHLIALVNKAYLNIAIGKVAEADALLQTALDAHGRDFYALYNLALLDIVQGNLVRAQDNLQEVVASSGHDSDELTSVLTYAMLAGGGSGSGSSEADALIPALQRLKANDRTTPATYLVLADIYRQRDQPLLALTELLNGRKKFPSDRNLLYELMLEYANQSEFAKYAALKDIVSEADFQSDYRTWLAEGLASSDVTEANFAFQQAFLMADENEQKEQVLIRWLRYLQNEGEATRAAEVAHRVSSFYEKSGGKPPVSLRMLQIWGSAPEANIAKRRAMMAEVIVELDENVQHPSDVQEDIAYALAALGDKRQAMRVLEPLAQNYGSKRNLQLLLWVYEGLEGVDESKIAEVNRRMDAIGVQEIAAAQKQEFLRAAEEIQDAGVAVARSGERNLKGVALSSNDQYSDIINLALAEQDYQRAIKVYSNLLDDGAPGYTPALLHQNRGVLYLKIKDYENALLDFSSALAGEQLSADDRHSVLYNRSLALIGMKQYKEARDVLAQLVEDTGDNLRNLVLYAQVLHGFNDSRAIVPIYERIIRISPEQITFYVRLADAYNKLERTKDAFNILQAGLRVDPNNADLHRTIAKLYALTGNQQKAQEHLQVVRNL